MKCAKIYNKTCWHRWKIILKEYLHDDTLYTRARDISKHIGSLMEGITQANGYETNMGARLYRGKLKIDDDEPPCCVLVEQEEHLGGTQGSQAASR